MVQTQCNVMEICFCYAGFTPNTKIVLHTQLFTENKYFQLAQDAIDARQLRRLFHKFASILVVALTFYVIYLNKMLFSRLV